MVEAIRPDGACLMEVSAAMLEVWTYRQTVTSEPTLDLGGFKVEAADGEIGTVDLSTTEAGKSWIVVDTGPWIFGKKIVLPASSIERAEMDRRTVFVDRTKDEIKSSPVFDPDRGVNQSYRDELARYYGGARVRS
jgi:hypothetical protein